MLLSQLIYLWLIEKGVWWMPWYQEAMKEAEDCHKLRGAVNQALIRRFPNGETHVGKTNVSLSEYIGQRGERCELKHLSNARKRKRM